MQFILSFQLKKLMKKNKNICEHGVLFYYTMQSTVVCRDKVEILL